MAQEIHLPKLGPTMKEGVIVAWLVAEGEQIREGQPLLQVETDKAVTEIESPVSGRVSRIVALKGQKVAVGDLLATVE